MKRDDIQARLKQLEMYGECFSLRGPFSPTLTKDEERTMRTLSRVQVNLHCTKVLAAQAPLILERIRLALQQSCPAATISVRRGTRGICVPAHVWAASPNPVVRLGGSGEFTSVRISDHVAWTANFAALQVRHQLRMEAHAIAWRAQQQAKVDA